MGTESAEERSGAEYLAQLLKDKKQIQAFPNVFIHLERLLDDGKPRVIRIKLIDSICCSVCSQFTAAAAVTELDTLLVHQYPL